jgi:hypothetical protein
VVDTRGNARRTETEAARVLSGAKVRVGDNIHDGGSPPRGFTPPLGSVGSRRQRRQEARGQVSKGKGTEERSEIGRLPRHKEERWRPTDIDCVVCGYGTRRRVHRWVGGNQAEGNWAGKTAERTDRQTEALQDQRSDAGAGRRAGGERDPREACRVKSSRKTAGIAAGTNNKHSVQSPAGVPARGPKGKAVGGKSERVEQVRD